ncbi:uncharacterized protein BDR25DRAFT_363761 [Lindgomyces ingoldianus]|uniref:Uncharacterized protein n=1 Tax=Lindgomyces ingoldianus TaxID=673940 RepID=A0ACB6Q939_9PLEO|nr:uncharacterized protein BDR25DRAFT_363761 [Lindgomyces ingoldianus]KAF2462650.1 hypothetical protein BDR25DRAFT_363761 [Lindgomyces ingoldianus]
MRYESTQRHMGALYVGYQKTTELATGRGSSQGRSRYGDPSDRIVTVLKKASRMPRHFIDYLPRQIARINAHNRSRAGTRGTRTVRACAEPATPATTTTVVPRPPQSLTQQALQFIAPAAAPADHDDYHHYY